MTAVNVFDRDIADALPARSGFDMAHSDNRKGKYGTYGAVLIGIGVLLLLLQLFGRAGHYLWPFFIIAPGVVLLLLSGMGAGSARFMATAGAIFTGIGTILLIQAVFDYFQSWAYAWTLIPFSAGAGMVYASHHEHDATLAERGRSMMRWAAIAFAVLGVVFEILVFKGGIFGGRFVVPLILIVIGGFLLYGRRGHSRDDEPPASGARTLPEPPPPPPPGGQGMP